MKCELCGHEIPVGLEECPSCSSTEELGKIRGILGDTIRFLSRQVKVEKGQGELYFRMGNFHRLSGSYDEAIACYEKALTDCQDKPQYYHLLGTAFAGKGDFRSSVEAMRRAVELAPTYPDYHNDLGAAYFKSARYEDAIREFEEAIRLNPKYANAHNNLAMAYRKIKKHHDAELEIQKAVELDPAHAIGGYELGLSYYSGGMFSQLKGGALKIDAKSLGDIFYFRQMYAEAVEQYLKALEIHPRYADIHYSLGLAYAGLKESGKAKEAFEKALELNPHYTQAREALDSLH
jgi:tetratricopeptide (TPR) repeat protein